MTMVPVSANEVSFDPTLESAAEQVRSAMVRVESGGKWDSVGDSGSYGTLQYTPGTWDRHSREFDKANGGIGSPLPLTPENEQKVSTYKIRDWLSAGYTPSQIAAKWNHGDDTVDWQGIEGVNKEGVAYSVPRHVAKFETAYYGKIQSPDLVQRFGDAIKGVFTPSEAQAAEIPKPKAQTLFAFDPGPDADYYEIPMNAQGSAVKKQAGGAQVSASIAWPKDQPLPNGVKLVERPKSVSPDQVDFYTMPSEETQPQAPTGTFTPVSIEDIDFSPTAGRESAGGFREYMNAQQQHLINYGAETAQYLELGAKDITDTFVKVGDLIHDATGGAMPRATNFAALSDEFNKQAQYYNSLIKNPTVTEELFGGGVGGFLPGTLKFVGGIPYAIVDGYTKNGFRGALDETIKRVTMGGILHSASQLNPVARSVVMAAAGGGEAAVEGGSLADIAKGAATMAVMGAVGPRSGKNAKQAVKDFYDTLPDKLRDEVGYIGPRTKEGTIQVVQDLFDSLSEVLNNERGSIQVSSTGKDIKAKSENLKNLLRSESGYIDLAGMWDGILRLTAPTMRGEEAARTGRIISENESRMERGMDQFVKRMEKVNKFFMKSTRAENLDFMQRMDTGLPQSTPEMQAVADIIDQMFKARLNILDQLGVGLENVRENYFPHIWKKDASGRAALAALEEQAQGTANLPVSRLDMGEVAPFIGRRPMEGSKAFTKNRVWDDVMTGINAGAEPVSYNPLDLVALKLHEIDKYIFAQRSFRALKQTGDMKFVKASEIRNIGVGWQKIDDRYGTVYRPVKDANGNTVGSVISGYWVAKDGPAQVIDNYLSQTLYNSKYFGSAFKMYMGAANTLNSFQLGMFSMFHAGFTSLESVISNASLGIKQVSQGRVKDAMRSFYQTPLGFIINPVEGRKVLKEWYFPGSQNALMAKIVEGIHLGGGKFGMDSQFQTSHVQKMIEDWSGGGIGGKVKAVLRSPAALSEISTIPILKWLVPAQKAGAFALMAEDWLKVNPNATHEETAKAMRQIWNRVDGRLGQVVYNRTFVNNTVKNVTQALMRAPGWKGGSAVEFGGAVKDLGEQVIKLSKGEGFEMTDRIAYVLATALVSAAINGTMTKTLTGDNPAGMDFFAFRVGRKDKYGNEVRFLSPSYLKDLYAYTQRGIVTPMIASTNPLLNLIVEEAKNKDYYGVEVRHEGDRIDKQALQTAQHVLTAFMPFWIRGSKKAAETFGASAAEKVIPLAGFMPASSEYTKTSAQLRADELLRKLSPSGDKTREEYDKMMLKSELKGRIRANDPTARADVGRAVMEGKLLQPEAGRLFAATKTTPFQDQVSFLESKSLDAAMSVYELASEDERQQIRGMLRNGVKNTGRLSEETKNKYMRILDQKGKGGVTTAIAGHQASR